MIGSNGLIEMDDHLPNTAGTWTIKPFRPRLKEKRRNVTPSWNPLKKCSVTLIGICCDHNSSFMRGPASAPDTIREALHCGSANLASETGVEPA